jgi:hypothetical protein
MIIPASEIDHHVSGHESDIDGPSPERACSIPDGRESRGIARICPLTNIHMPIFFIN